MNTVTPPYSPARPRKRILLRIILAILCAGVAFGALYWLAKDCAEQYFHLEIALFIAAWSAAALILSWKTRWWVAILIWLAVIAVALATVALYIQFTWGSLCGGLA